MRKFKDGEPCGHPGCLRHATHPCEGCGRIAERTCPKCGGTKFIDKYFDAGDHFGAGTSPFSEWVKIPCPVCSSMVPMGGQRISLIKGEK